MNIIEAVTRVTHWSWRAPAEDVTPTLPVFRASPISGDSTEPLICQANTIWLERQKVSRSLRRRAVAVEDRPTGNVEEKRQNDAIAHELRVMAEDIANGMHRED